MKSVEQGVSKDRGRQPHGVARNPLSFGQLPLIRPAASLKRVRDRPPGAAFPPANFSDVSSKRSMRRIDAGVTARRIRRRR